MTMSNVAERAEEIRDLRNTITELNQLDNDNAPPIFRENSPARRKVSLWSKANGEEIRVLAGNVNNVLSKRGPNGYLWTARKADAPTFIPGTIKCFLHPEAPEHEVIAKLGIATTCKAASYPNRSAMETVAEHKHKAEWKAYQKYLADEEKREDRERQQQQLDAMLALATRPTEGK
jgi:hypothetical protein